MSDAANNYYQRQVDQLYKAYSDADATRNEAIAAVAGKKIRVLSYLLNAAGGENDVTFESGAVALTGAMEVANNASVHASFNGGVFETTAGVALNITQSAATLVAGHITYILV